MSAEMREANRLQLEALQAQLRAAEGLATFLRQQINAERYRAYQDGSGPIAPKP